MLKNIVLPFNTVAGTNETILTSVQDDKEFVDGKPTGRVIGSRYGIACFANGFAQVTVRVPNAPPAITQEALDARNATGDFVFCTFEGFVGKIFQDFRSANKEAKISATANAIKILGDSGKS